VTGVDDSQVAQACSPEIETIRFCMSELGNRAAENLLKQMSGADVFPCEEMVGYKIIKGASVGPCNK